MLIGGINTLTLLDYPDKLACIIFIVGCNFRCGFCHNPQFVLPEEIQNFKPEHLIPEGKFFQFLETRKGLLDGVVISGGEPTLHSDLILFLKKIKNLGFLVKLDTNGTNPEVLRKIMENKCVDYFAMDIKASPQKYNKLIGTKINFTNIEKSKDLIISSEINHEFRTTVIPNFHDKSEIKKITQFCKGANKFTIQNFRNTKVLDPKYKKLPGFNPEELKEFKTIAKKFINNVETTN